MQPLSYKIEEKCYDVVLAPSHLHNGQETFYISTAQCLKVFIVPTTAKAGGDKITLTKSSVEVNTPSPIVSGAQIRALQIACFTIR